MERRPFPALSLLLILFAAIHGILLVHDALNPGAIFAGDRVGSRIEKIEMVADALNNGQPVTPILIEKGDPGDYLYHAVVFSVSGKWGVIIVQILLMGLGGIFLFRLVDLAFKSEKLAGITTLVFFLLPGSLYHPHSVTSEGLANPLMIIYAFLLVRLFSERSRKYSQLVLLGLLATILSSLRLIYVLYPVVTFGLLIWDKQAHRLVPSSVFLLVAMTLPGIWISLYHSETGELSYGPSDHSLDSNIRGRLRRMSQFDDGVTIEEPGNSAVYQLVSESVSHPGAFLKSALTDMSNMLFNSGVNTVAGRYLGVYEMPTDRSYWAEIRDREGPFAMFLHIFKQSRSMVAANVVFGIAWVLFFLLSVYGLFLLARMKSVDSYIRFTLISLPIYFCLLSLSASGVRWDMRTPFEFVLCIGFILTIFLRTSENALEWKPDAIRGPWRGTPR